MLDYIQSKAIKRYLNERQIELDDKIKYALISNRHSLFNERMESLAELAAGSCDDEVRMQAFLKIQNEKEWLSIFSSNLGEQYYYDVLEEEDETKELVSVGHFRYFKHAAAYAKKTALEYDTDVVIELEYIVRSSEQTALLDDYDNKDILSGHVRYNKQGLLLGCQIYGRQRDQLIQIENPIEQRWYSLPHPFQKGDILKRIEGDEEIVFIVTRSVDDEYEYLKEREKRLANSGVYCPLEWDDISLSAVMIDMKKGIIWDQDDPFFPYDFEYYCEISDKTADMKERMLLQMQKMIRGQQFSFQYIQNALSRLHEDYNYNNRYGLITGIDLQKTSIGD